MTRWSATVGGAALGLLVLLAVPTIGSIDPPPTTTAPTPTAGPTASDPDARFDAEIAYTARVQNLGMQVANMPFDDLTRLGWALCDGLRQRPEPYVSAAPGAGISSYDTRVLVDAATRHLCPGQRDKVRTYLEEDR